MATKKTANKAVEVAAEAEDIIASEPIEAAEQVESELVPVFVKSAGQGFRMASSNGRPSYFVDVTCNGKTCEVLCDEQVSVPPEVAEILKNAGLLA